MKRREEEKALRLNALPIDPLSLEPLTSQPNYLTSHTPTSLQANTTPSSSSTRPIAYTPSPPSTDKIPRRSDPPMKRKSIGNLSPTLRKNKDRLPIANNLVVNSSDASGVYETYPTSMTSS